MSVSVTRWALPCAALMCLGAVACTTAPEPAQPGPLDEPFVAFETIGEPVRPGASDRDRRNLSTDIERLQNARSKYENEQERLSAEARRRQAECRARADSREVPIEDGSGDPAATYCQPAEDGDR